MARYSTLPDHIRTALHSVTPSDGGGLLYFPCRVTLRDGKILDAVYIEPEIPYLQTWGMEDRGESVIRIEDVLKVEDSPTRLPPQFANEIYRGGESGMGYTIFTVLFSDGQRQAYATGNAVDFITYPEGKTPIDVVAVEPHEGRHSNPVTGPTYYWCLFSEDNS
jgi:hypothetical protein